MHLLCYLLLQHSKVNCENVVTELVWKLRLVSVTFYTHQCLILVLQV